jgi:hypothetical protein
MYPWCEYTLLWSVQPLLLLSLTPSLPSPHYSTAFNTYQFYSAIRINETMWFAGKWIELEDIMLSEVSQVQKDKGHVFSLICGR